MLSSFVVPPALAWHPLPSSDQCQRGNPAVELGVLDEMGGKLRARTSSRSLGARGLGSDAPCRERTLLVGRRGRVERVCGGVRGAGVVHIPAPTFNKGPLASFPLWLGQPGLTPYLLRVRPAWPAAPLPLDTTPSPYWWASLSVAGRAPCPVLPSEYFTSLCVFSSKQQAQF